MMAAQVQHKDSFPPVTKIGPNPDLQAACSDARSAALLAWEKIAGFYRGTFDVFEKDSDGPATEADIMADRFILAYLGSRYPETSYGYLSEETAHGLERMEKDYCWIIDPIDGTRDFMEGLGDFAVQIGLAARGPDGFFHPVVGIVYQPVAAMLYRAVLGGGTWRENLLTGGTERITVSDVIDPTDCNMVVTRSHMGRRLRLAMEAIDPKASYQAGSLGVKVAHVAEQRADLYLNTSRRFCKEWDTCAPHAILNEAGGLLTDMRGRQITYNKADVYIDDGLIACNKILHREVVLRLASVQHLW